MNSESVPVMNMPNNSLEHMMIILFACELVSLDQALAENVSYVGWIRNQKSGGSLAAPSIARIGASSEVWSNNVIEGRRVAEKHS
jgi:hypothetical protein